ncbi:MAG: hypothetical protein ACYC5Q_05390 [Thermoleophilia bacterium]
MILLMATMFALAFAATVAAVTAPTPNAPAPVSTGGSALGIPSGPGLITQEVASPAQSQAGHGSAAVTVSARIEPARLLVLDGEGRVVEIWSNTGGGHSDPLLTARLHSVDGPELLEIPERALSEYRLLLDQVDWSVRGLTYATD